MKNKRVFSIKRRLTLTSVVLSGGLLLVSLYFSYSNAKHEVTEVYDARLGQSAKLLLMATSVSGQKMATKDQREHFDSWMENIQRLSKAKEDVATLFGHPYEQYFLFQFYRDGKLLFSSDNSLPGFSSGVENIGFSNISINGESWRFFQLTQPNGTMGKEYVVVAERQRIRREMVNEIALSTALPQLILFPCLMLLLVTLIDRSFRPIQSLKSAIAIRSVHKLDRIYVEEPTLELSPLVDTLNQLLSELEHAWEREKRFTRMAAHELKTPLTVLRLNAENALRSTNPEQLKHDLERIFKGIERTDRLIQQLLMLAKVESTQILAKQPVDLAGVIKQVIADLAPIAFKQEQQLSFSGESPRLWGDELLLGILFKNLLDNAIRYSGCASHIEVILRHQEGEIEVCVLDTGAPIDDLTREKMFDNFYRANSQKGDGAGLGMSICRDIATLHGGEVMLLPRTNKYNSFVVRFRNIE